jgi:methylenetetrahydrofolate reductase (NADPH)
VIPDRSIQTLLAETGRPLLSFEFFPPRTDEMVARLSRTSGLLRAAEPDFVTVTYGAGGSTRRRTLEVCGLLRVQGFAPVMPHLTCVGSSREELHALADELYAEGYRNVMALRGDPPRDQPAFQPHPDGLHYAGELVRLLRERHPDVCCGVAGYPETHPEAPSPAADIEYLKWKLDAGACFVTTQLFYDNRVYFDYLERCRTAGITQPILPGLLPAVSLKQVRRMTSMCNASLPPALVRDLEAAGEDEDAAVNIGLEWVMAQMKELLQAGVPGIHLYILNRARTGLALALRNHFDWVKPDRDRTGFPA